MVSPVAGDPVPLATAADFTARFPEIARSSDPLIIAETMVEATDHIEQLVSRRLAPFTGHVYEDRLYGIDPSEYGDQSVSQALPWAGSLGMTLANALGADGLVRHFWLDQFAPHHSELWTYDIQSVNIQLTYGNSIAVDFQNGGMVGPAVTDGHIWLRLGTFAPVGSRVIVQYGGGYTVAIPPALKRACLYQAVLFLGIDAEPMLRAQMNYDALEGQIVKLLAPWART